MPQNIEPLGKEEIQQGKGFGFSFFKMSDIKPGSPAKLRIVGVSKLKGTRYPIPGLDYAYRFQLETGQVMDVSSKTVSGRLLRLGFSGAGEEFQPFEVEISRKASNKLGESPYEIKASN